MRITFISDTHNKHRQITEDLPGGDLLVHTGDISSMGYEHEIQQFCKWFDSLGQYDHKVFIAGNHDWGFQDNAEKVSQIINSYKWIDYLQDDWIVVGDADPHDPDVKTAKIYGSPWQPEFYNWAFNLPRNGEELLAKWESIPVDTDILLTHGPAWGYVDTVQGRRSEHLGCELLTERIKAIKPKIHVCGHIHTGHGYTFKDGTHYINASVLNESYLYAHKPLTVEWNPETNELVFL
jgi:Icc-related predicted phosphoesterase